MSRLVQFPLLLLVLSFVTLWFFAEVGVYIRNLRPLKEGEREDLSMVLTATLTLLGLIIAFSFSMAISRYDQRKNYEEEEANAIGTEYLRADLLPATDAARVHELLRDYLRHRVLFYETRHIGQLQQISSDTARVQNEMWSVVKKVAASQPTPTVALAVWGMNDVLNSQGYTQSAWWNHIPAAAWVLMAAIALFSNLLVGYAAHRTGIVLFLVLPLALSISFCLIADIDSPRRGLIRVVPYNLISVYEVVKK